MYNANRGGKSFATPTSPGGTKFFNHFPSNFLRPYGLAGPAPDHHTLQRRINPVCCEWLKRPHIAMSEFAATMVENFNFLAASSSTFINNEIMNEKRQNCDQFLETLANLNTKNPQGSPRPEHVRLVMEKMYDDTDSLHDIMSEFFQIGGSMFIMAIQYIMARDLMCHPDEYADKMVATDHITNLFKQERSVPGLLQMLSTTCAHAPSSQGLSQGAAHRNLLQELRRASHSSFPLAPASAPSTSGLTQPTSQPNAQISSLKRAVSKAQASSSDSSSSSEESSSDVEPVLPPKRARPPPPVKNAKRDKSVARNEIGKNKKSGSKK